MRLEDFIWRFEFQNLAVQSFTSGMGWTGMRLRSVFDDRAAAWSNRYLLLGPVLFPWHPFEFGGGQFPPPIDFPDVAHRFDLAWFRTHLVMKLAADVIVLQMVNHHLGALPDPEHGLVTFFATAFTPQGSDLRSGLRGLRQHQGDSHAHCQREAGSGAGRMESVRSHDDPLGLSVDPSSQ